MLNQVIKLTGIATVLSAAAVRYFNVPVTEQRASKHRRQLVRVMKNMQTPALEVLAIHEVQQNDPSLLLANKAALTVLRLRVHPLLRFAFQAKSCDGDDQQHAENMRSFIAFHERHLPEQGTIQLSSKPPVALLDEEALAWLGMVTDLEQL